MQDRADYLRHRPSARKIISASEAAEIGAVDYVFKPINSDILKSKVKVYLRPVPAAASRYWQLNATLRQSNEELAGALPMSVPTTCQEPVRMMKPMPASWPKIR